MPSITLYSSRRQLQVQEFSPSANLVQSLNALASSNNVDPPYTFKVYNSDMDQLHLTSARSVGAQPLEAEVDTAAAATLHATVLTLEAEVDTAAAAALRATVLTLESRMAVLNSDMAAVKEQLADLWVPRVRNLAPQLLLLACERETLRTTTTGYFQQMGVQYQGVCALAAVMAVEPAQMVAQADGVISRRNSDIHFGNLAELEQEVEAVQHAITPQLEARCRWECKFVKAYSDIKKAFPTRFV